jgi:large subunit ribosomal protein L15
MLKLHTLTADPGKTQKTKRLGRGEGSGQGGTSGKGHKGEQARSGRGHRGASFEGGQMPMIRRLPKFGFDNTAHRVQRAEVTLRQLNRFEDGATVDIETLHKARLVSKKAERVKLIATGELERKLTVRLNGFSAKARQAVETAGGACETV